jgi:hypothetical protein
MLSFARQYPVLLCSHNYSWFFLGFLKVIGHLSDASQILLHFAAMKTRTKAKAKTAMKKLYTQLPFEFE